MRVDLVVTYFREKLVWLDSYASRPGWHIYAYSNRRQLLPELAARLCRRAAVSCVTTEGNAGYEWQGYLTHMVRRYDRLADTTIFLQANPFKVSPDLACLLERTAEFAPIQALSWVQGGKKGQPLFGECRAAWLGGCRVWVEPVGPSFLPLLHGDAYARSLRPHKRMAAMLYAYLMVELGGGEPNGDGAAANATPAAYERALRAVPTPPRLYRTYGAQFGATRAVLTERPRAFYGRLLRWLSAPSWFEAEVRRAGLTGNWCGASYKDKAVLLEYAWFSLLRAERFVRRDVCADCLPLARRLSAVRRGQAGPSCAADFLLGAPRAGERCVLSGDVRCNGQCRPWDKRLTAAQLYGSRPHCDDGELTAMCETTMNEYERNATTGRRAVWTAAKVRGERRRRRPPRFKTV